MSLRITVCVGVAPRQVLERELDLADGGTVADVLDAIQSDGMPNASGFRIAVWGRAANSALKLKDGDRVELLRGLRVDPKVARRERFAQQGSRSAGLFSKKRAGAKSGY